MQNPFPSPLNHPLLNPRRNTNERGSTPKNLRFLLLNLQLNTIYLNLLHDLLPSGEDILKLKELMDFCTNLSNKVLNLKSEVIDIKSTYQEKSSKHGRKIADIDADFENNLKKAQAEAYNLDLDHQEKVLSMLDVNDKEPADVEEVLEVVKVAKLVTKVVTTAKVDVNAASVQDTPITTAEATKVIIPRKRRGVIIQDHEETTTTVIVLPKVEAELNVDINWNVVIKQVKRSERLTDAVMKYQTLKRKPLTEAQARRNMIAYLKNMAGYKMDYFKRMSYDEIRPLFEKHYNYNQAFLNEVNISGPSGKLDGTPTLPDGQDTTKTVETNLVCTQNLLGSLERFAKTEPKNYSDDFLLNTLKIMLKKPNVEANVWKDQKGTYGLAKDPEIIPRGLAWSRKQLFKRSDYSLSFSKDSPMNLDLTPMISEQQTVWFLVVNERAYLWINRVLLKFSIILASNVRKNLMKNLMNCVRQIFFYGPAMIDLDPDDDLVQDYLIQEESRLKYEEKERCRLEEHKMMEALFLKALQEEVQRRDEKQKMLKYDEDKKKRRHELMNLDH
nr:phospholipase-like protein [Tanacetum cinerariifolium]